MPLDQIPEPWKSFLSEVDAQLEDRVTLICLGGFVLTLLYDLRRPTSDVDVIELARNPNWERVSELAGRNSKLHKKYHVYLDPVTVAQYPENFESRLREMFPGTFHQLRLFALDPYDLVLSKLDRNSQKDRDDVKYLAQFLRLDLELLRLRFEQEFEPHFVGNTDTVSKTLQLWIEMIEEVRSSSSRNL
jgi:uncharacterized nucleotidyltransferase DUF6036